MKVYVVEMDGYEGGFIEAIFATEKLAKAYARKENKATENRRKADAKKYNFPYHKKSDKLIVVEHEVLEKIDEVV